MKDIWLPEDAVPAHESSPVMLPSKQLPESVSAKMRDILESDKNSPTYFSSSELFARHPYLEENFMEELGSLRDGDFVGEGTYGIIFRSEKWSSVAKYPLHPEGRRAILREAENHSAFYSAWKQGRNMLPKDMVIPRIRMTATEDVPVLTIERMQGVSLKSIRLYMRHKELLKRENPLKLLALTDRQFETLLEKKYKIERALIDTSVEDGLEALRCLHPGKAEHLEQVLQYLKDHGLVHTDLHSGNLMLDNKGRTCIIDYGKTNFRLPQEMLSSTRDEHNITVDGIDFCGTTWVESGLLDCALAVKKGVHQGWMEFDRNHIVYDIWMEDFLIEYTSADRRADDIMRWRYMDINNTHVLQKPDTCGTFEYDGKYYLIAMANFRMEGETDGNRYKGLIINPEGWNPVS